MGEECGWAGCWARSWGCCAGTDPAARPRTVPPPAAPRPQAAAAAASRWCREFWVMRWQNLQETERDEHSLIHPSPLHPLDTSPGPCAPMPGTLQPFAPMHGSHGFCRRLRPRQDPSLPLPTHNSPCPILSSAAGLSQLCAASPVPGRLWGRCSAASGPWGKEWGADQ